MSVSLNKISQQTNTYNSLIYILADVLDSYLVELESGLKKDGFKVRHDVKFHLKKTIFHAKNLVDEINKLTENETLSIQYTGDFYAKFLMLLIDRTGMNDDKLKDVWRDIFNMTSEIGLKVDDFCFE